MTFEIFNQKIIDHPRLKCQVMSTKNIDEFIELAKEYGVDLTKSTLEEKFRRMVRSSGELSQLSDEELAIVSGGNVLKNVLTDMWDGVKYGICHPLDSWEVVYRYVNGEPIYFTKAKSRKERCKYGRE